MQKYTDSGLQVVTYGPTNLSPINFDDVISSYNGKSGFCCCGCSGKHSYSAAKVEQASEAIGYVVDPDDVNDRAVRIAVNKINQAIKENPHTVMPFGSGYAIDTRTRTTAIYFK